MKFNKIYDDEKRSKCPRLIRTTENKVYQYDVKTGQHKQIPNEDIKAPHSVIEFYYKGENQLKNVYDVKRYKDFIQFDICKRLLQLPNWNFDFLKIEQLIKFLVQNSLKGELFVDNNDLLNTIDQASAGGVLIAEKGKHEGKFTCYDINNSYNKYFLDYDLPSNPKFETVKEITKKVHRIYRLKIPSEYRTKEYNNKFKTSRLWFTYFDIKIFRMFDIPFELVQEENNCIVFQDTVESNFEWMEKVNELKQKSSGYQKDILKQILSSTWGTICRYEKQQAFASVDDVPEYAKNKPNLFIGGISRNYFCGVHPKSSESEYINPSQRFKYAIAMVKPFVLAYGRLRLLEQVKLLQDKNKKVIYAHTDSIITDGKKKYFDIGTQIGEFKKECESAIGVEIKNIASKIFLE